jgi:hypothetical protein
MITKKNIKKTAKIAGLLLGAGILAQGISREFFSEKIKNTGDLIRIVRQEESSIKVDNLPRIVYLTYGHTEWGTACSGKIGKGKYIILLDKERNRTVIRHELYHIYAGHCDKAAEKGEWGAWDKVRDEFSAMMYADYGLRF